MRLLICAGGTGGGVYPALAVLQALKYKVEASNLNVQEPTFNPQLSILWAGGVGGMEAELVKRAGISFTAIPAAGVHGVGLHALPRNLLQLSRGFLAARRVLGQFKPEVLLFTGGYLAVPMALAARLPYTGRKRPLSLLYVPDIEPGLALKTLARFADHIAVTVEQTLRFLPRRTATTVTGYPVRNDLRSWDVQNARRILGLVPDLPTLLVLGGSLGARSINRNILEILPDLLVEMQVVHLTGQRDWPEVEKAWHSMDVRSLHPEIASRYHAFPYLHDEMGAAMATADLALARAGASSLGEFPLLGLPAILVPYPHAWRYQHVNARYLAEQGAAVIVEDADLSTQLSPVIRGLMQDHSRRGRMQQAMRALARPQAAETIAAILCDLAVSAGGEGG